MSIVQFSNQPSGDKIQTPETKSSLSPARVNAGVALKIFLNSLFIQSSFNYRGMQNLGFAFALLPLVRLWGGSKERQAALLTRHLQLFNTHPYLSAPIIGSVVRLEEDNREKDKAGVAAVNLKNALMGPYAALGDSFFWGAMKPLTAVISVLLALQGYLLAPLVWLFLYNPVHLWVRVGGFIEGYRHGKEGIDFIRHLELPQLTGRMRWISLAGLGAIGALISQSLPTASLGLLAEFITPVVFWSLIILCYWGIKNGISQVKIIYGMFIIGCALSY